MPGFACALPRSGTPCESLYHASRRPETTYKSLSHAFKVLRSRLKVLSRLRPLQAIHHFSTYSPSRLIQRRFHPSDLANRCVQRIRGERGPHHLVACRWVVNNQSKKYQGTEREICRKDDHCGGDIAVPVRHEDEFVAILYFLRARPGKRWMRVRQGVLNLHESAVIQWSKARAQTDCASRIWVTVRAYQVEVYRNQSKDSTA